MAHHRVSSPPLLDLSGSPADVASRASASPAAQQQLEDAIFASNAACCMYFEDSLYDVGLAYAHYTGTMDAGVRRCMRLMQLREYNGTHRWVEPTEAQVDAAHARVTETVRDDARRARLTDAEHVRRTQWQACSWRAEPSRLFLARQIMSLANDIQSTAL